MLRCLAAPLGGVLLSQAFEPVGLAVLLPLGLAGLVLCVRGLPARRAWLPGLALRHRVPVRPAVLDAGGGPRAWAGADGVPGALLRRARVGGGGAAAPWPGGRRAWVAVETIRSDWPFSGMPWGRLSYAVADTLWQGATWPSGWPGSTCWRCWARPGPAGHRPARVRVAALVAVGGVAAVSLLPPLAPFTVPTTDRARPRGRPGRRPGRRHRHPARPPAGDRQPRRRDGRLADEVAAGEQPEPDFVVWPENSTAVDPFLDSEVNAGIARPRGAIGVPDAGRRDGRRGPEHVLNQGIVWEPAARRTATPSGTRCRSASTSRGAARSCPAASASCG